MNAKQIKAVKQEVKFLKDLIKYFETVDLAEIKEYDNDSEFGQAINEVSNFIGLLDDLEELA